MRLAFYSSSFLAIALLVIPCSAGAADGPDLVARGFALAQRDCGACHAAGLKDLSPHRITPALRDLHTRFPITMLVETGKTGAVAGHDEMPEFQYLLDDARALISYIDSLAPPGKRYLARP